MTGQCDFCTAAPVMAGWAGDRYDIEVKVCVDHVRLMPIDVVDVVPIKADPRACTIRGCDLPAILYDHALDRWWPVCAAHTVDPADCGHCSICEVLVLDGEWREAAFGEPTCGDCIEDQREWANRRRVAV